MAYGDSTATMVHRGRTICHYTKDERRTSIGLTLQETESLVHACLAKSRQMGLPISIAIVDERADLLCAVPMDGACSFTIEIARGKQGSESKRPGQLPQAVGFCRRLDQSHEPHVQILPLACPGPRG